jgi:predicted phosphohydrolase
MRVFAIGDPHLSHFKSKPMDIFGENWRDHDKQIMENWNAIAADDDILILAGDLSWALKLEEFLPDLEYIAALKGRKILIKGNHDLWWSSPSKVRKILPSGVDILQHESIVINGVAFVGTRGSQDL